MSEKSKQNLVKFAYDKHKYSFILDSVEEDYWESLTAPDGVVFDFHYCEDYNQICVYIPNDETYTAIHTQKIRSITIDEIEKELRDKYNQVSIQEFDYLYAISIDGGKTVKIKKDTLYANKIPTTIKLLLK
jgi:hypothetical protein